MKHVDMFSLGLEYIIQEYILVKLVRFQVNALITR